MTNDLVGEEFTNRPDDDELAFVYYEKMFRSKLDAELEHCDDGRTYDHHMQTYINSVLATIRALGINHLNFWVENPASASDTNNFRQIKFDIDSCVLEIQIKHAQLIRKNSVHLSAEEKEKIRELIGKIRTTIDSFDLPLSKKEVLFSKLNAFAAEVDRDRTRFEALGALLIETAGVLGAAEEKIRPIRKWIDSIANLIHEARLTEDMYPRLPKPFEKIEGPKEQKSPKRIWSSASNPDLDDEIPF